MEENKDEAQDFIQNNQKTPFPEMEKLRKEKLGGKGRIDFCFEHGMF